MIHHTRKMPDSDPFNQITGSIGLSGCADGSFVLAETYRGSGVGTLTCADKEQFREKLNNRCSDNSGQKIVQLENSISQAQERISELDRIMNRLYEDSALGRIPESRYEQMTKTYESEQAELKNSIPELRRELEALKAKTDAAERFTEVIDRYTKIRELNAEILNGLIDRIVVHSREEVNGRVYQQVEIFYRFVGDLTAKAREAA